MIFKILPNPNHSVHVLHTTIFSNSLGSNSLSSNFLGSNSPSRIPPCRGRQQCSCRLCTGSAFAAASGALQDSLAFCSGWKFSGQGAEDHSPACPWGTHQTQQDPELQSPEGWEFSPCCLQGFSCSLEDPVGMQQRSCPAPRQGFRDISQVGSAHSEPHLAALGM